MFTADGVIFIWCVIETGGPLLTVHIRPQSKKKKKQFTVCFPRFSRFAKMASVFLNLANCRKPSSWEMFSTWKLKCLCHHPDDALDRTEHSTNAWQTRRGLRQSGISNKRLRDLHSVAHEIFLKLNLHESHVTCSIVKFACLRVIGRSDKMGKSINLRCCFAVLKVILLVDWSWFCSNIYQLLPCVAPV